MTTIDPKLAELMHAELDGRITDEDRAVLRKTLSCDEDARGYFERLQSMSQILANMEDISEPESLHEDILRSVRAVPGPSTRGLRAWLESWRVEPRRVLRYGYALAAGVLLGVVAMVGLRGTLPFAPSLVSGTMGQRQVTGDLSAGRDIPIDLPEVEGHVTLYSSEEGLVVQSLLTTKAATSPVQVIVSFDPALAGFQGMSQSEGTLQGLQVAPGRVSWEFLGQHGASLQLGVAGSGPAEIRIGFRADGAPVHEIVARTDGLD